MILSPHSQSLIRTSFSPACLAALALTLTQACGNGSAERDQPGVAATDAPSSDMAPAAPGNAESTAGSVGAPAPSSDPAPSPTPQSPAGMGGTQGAPAPTVDEPQGGNAASGGASTGNDIPDGSTPVATYGQLKVSGNQIVDQQGEPVLLHGQGFGWDNWWPQYYNANVVKWLRDDWCVDVVRPAMGIEPEGAYLSQQSDSKGRIRAVVDAAIESGVYVIIDWHAHDIHQAEAISFFTEMAQAYGDKPNVLYEIFNEPDQETWSEVKSYAEAVIAAIRRHDPDNLVIVGNPEWDQRVDQAAADPITSDPNVVYALHFYADTHKQSLRDRAQAALDQGVALLVSESGGADAAGQGALNLDEWNTWFDFLDKNNVTWLNYSIADKAGEPISVLQPGASADGGWTPSELTESGKFIRDKLRSYCNQ